MKQIKELKIGLPDATVKNTYKGDEPAPKKVEPEILADGTKVWPKVERRKVRAGFRYTDKKKLYLVRSVERSGGPTRGREESDCGPFGRLCSFGCSTSAPSPELHVRSGPFTHGKISIMS